MARKVLTDTIFVAATLGLALAVGLAALIGGNEARGVGVSVDGWVLAGLYVAVLGLFATMRQRVALRQDAEVRALEHALEETRTLYALLADNATDVVVRTEPSGVVAYASPAMARLASEEGLDLAGRHLIEMIHPSHVAAVMSLHEGALEGSHEARWVEFVGSGPLGPHQAGGRERWFEMQVQPLRDEHGRVYGAVSLLRDIAERKALEERLFEAGLTDPMTGLSNRRAFVAALQRHVEDGSGGCLAMFDLDHFRALNDRHGHAVGDKILVIFAQLARSLVRAGDMVARIGGEKFAVILPNASAEQAAQVCGRIIAAFSGTSRVVDDAIVRASVSGGVGAIEESADTTMRAADLALHAAKAKGRDRLELAPRLRGNAGRRW